MTRVRRTDEEILRDIAGQHGFTRPDELEAFKGTAAYQAALAGERLGDLGWAIMGAFRIPQLAEWIDRRLSR